MIRSRQTADEEEAKRILKKKTLLISDTGDLVFDRHRRVSVRVCYHFQNVLPSKNKPTKKKKKKSTSPKTVDAYRPRGLLQCAFRWCIRSGTPLSVDREPEF